MSTTRCLDCATMGKVIVLKLISQILRFLLKMTRVRQGWARGFVKRYQRMSEPTLGILSVQDSLVAVLYLFDEYPPMEI